MYVQICVCTILRIFFKKINFEKNLTLEIFNFDFLDFDFDYSDFDILSILNIFNFIICYIVLYHRLAIWMTYDHLFVFHDSRYLE